MDIPIEPLGAVDRRQRGACNVRACAHRPLEQISRVVSPDISPNDYSSGARGCAAATAPEQGPQRGLLRTEIKFHRRVPRIEPATAASCGSRVHWPVIAKRRDSFPVSVVASLICLPGAPLIAFPAMSGCREHPRNPTFRSFSSQTRCAHHHRHPPRRARQS